MQVDVRILSHRRSFMYIHECTSLKRGGPCSSSSFRIGSDTTRSRRTRQAGEAILQTHDSAHPLLRGQILVESESRPAMQAFLATWLDAVRALPKQRNVRWSIDVDPVDLY